LRGGIVVSAGVAGPRAAEREVPQAAIPQVLKRQASDLAIIDAQYGKAHVTECAAQIDGGQAGREHPLRDAAVVNAGQDAVTLPIHQPRGSRFPSPCVRK